MISRCHVGCSNRSHSLTAKGLFLLYICCVHLVSKGFAFSRYSTIGAMASPMFGFLLYEYVVHIPILLGILNVCLCLFLVVIVHMLLGRCECLEGHSFVAIGDACVACNMLCIWMQYRAQPHMFVNIITERVMSCKISKQMRYKVSLLRGHVQTNTSIDNVLC